MRIQEGDPGKLEYFKNPAYSVTPMLFPMGENIDPRLCPGCMFPNAFKKHEHVNDARCALWRAKQTEAQLCP